MTAGLLGVAVAAGWLIWDQGTPREAVLKADVSGDQARPEIVRPDHLIGIASEFPEDRPPYPDDWVSSLEEVRTLNEFEAVLPNTKIANEDNATGYFVPPDGSMVSSTYPLGSQEMSDVRQDYIEVWQSPWRIPQSPDRRLKMVLKESNIEGAFLDEIRAVPMVVVPAHSPTAIGMSNPSLVWFVIGRIEYQVSGGDSMDDILGIVDDIIAESRAGKTG